MEFSKQDRMIKKAKIFSKPGFSIENILRETKSDSLEPELTSRPTNSILSSFLNGMAADDNAASSEQKMGTILSNSCTLWPYFIKNSGMSTAFLIVVFLVASYWWLG